MNVSQKTKAIQLAEKSVYSACGVADASTDPITVSSATETSIIGAGRGSLSLPKNFFRSQDALALRLAAIYSTDDGGAGDGWKITFRLKLNNTTILQVDAGPTLEVDDNIGAITLEFFLQCPKAGFLNLSGKSEYFDGSPSGADDKAKSRYATSPLDNSVVGGLLVNHAIDTAQIIDVDVTAQCTNVPHPGRQLRVHSILATKIPRP